MEKQKPSLIVVQMPSKEKVDVVFLEERLDFGGNYLRPTNLAIIVVVYENS